MIKTFLLSFCLMMTCLLPAQTCDKIYQPFFTTKPTGEGTGLGLSLVYDIITKEHGGQIKVETEEGKYTEFIITLPTGKA